MKIKAIMMIRWSDGHKSDIGTLDFTYVKNGIELKGRNCDLVRRFGWAMMKQGFIMMVKGGQPESEGDIFGNGKKIEN